MRTRLDALRTVGFAFTAILATLIGSCGPSRPQVGIIEFTGEFGQSPTPERFSRMLAQARERQLAAVVLVFDTSFQPGPDISLKERFDQVFTYERYAETLEAPGPRSIAWVRSATGAAAIFPLTIPELYLHPAGRIGDTRSMVLKLFEQRTEQVPDGARREWYGYNLRQGHAAVNVEKAGRNFRLAFPIFQPDMDLWARQDPQGVTYHERQHRRDGDIPITDSNGLYLDAATAIRLGIVKGPIATLDELLAAAGLAGHPTVDLASLSPPAPAAPALMR